MGPDGDLDAVSGAELSHQAGEVGFDGAWVVTCHLFALRMSYSGKAVHRASATDAGALPARR